MNPDRDLVENFLKRDFFQGPDLAAPAPFLRADLDLGRFKLVELIGAGGMGEVWKAWAPDLRRHVAVKFVRGGDQTRLEREARIVAQMDHPNIAPVFETGRIEGRLYLVMPLVEGGTIHRANLGRPQIVAAIRDAARALDYAHQRGIVHRDIKPANILVGGDRIHLMDFGVARETRVDASVSIDGSILGTPQYMSPEQTRGSKVDGRADVYSLGATLHELLAGKPPFDGASLYDVLKKVQEEDATALRKIDRTVPEDLERVVLKCLEKDPDRRYASASHLADDLQRFLDGEPVVARPAGAALRLRRGLVRRRWPVAALVAGGLAASLAIAWFFIQKPERDYLDAFGSGMRAWAEARVSTFGATPAAPDRARTARTWFERAAALKNRAAVHVMRGRCFQIEGNSIQAEAAFEAAHRCDPADPEARLELAKLILTKVRIERKLPPVNYGTDGEDSTFGVPPPETSEMAGERERALNLLKGISSGLDFPAGLTAMSQGDYREAAKRLGKYTEAEGWDASALALEGICRYFASEYEKAEVALSKSLGLSPNPETRFRRGLVRALRKDFRRAEEDFSQILLGQPDDIRALRWRGNVRTDLAEVDGALSDYARIVELNPGDGGAWNNLGFARYLKKDFAGALRDFEKACELSPRSASNLYNRGNARLNLNDLKGAIADYDRAIEIEPSLSRAWANRGVAMRSLGKFAEAAADFDRAIEHNAGNLVAFAGRGFCKYRLKDLDGARKDFDHVLERNPDYYQSRYHRALVRKAQGDWEGAKEDIDRAAKAQPEDPHYLADRALILEGCADRDAGRATEFLEEAERAMDLALQLAPAKWDRRRHVIDHLKRIREKLRTRSDD